MQSLAVMLSFSAWLINTPVAFSAGHILLRLGLYDLGRTEHSYVFLGAQVYTPVHTGVSTSTLVCVCVYPVNLHACSSAQTHKSKPCVPVVEVHTKVLSMQPCM